MLKEATKAMADFKHGLSIEPMNQGCTAGLARVNEQMFSGPRDEVAIANAMKVRLCHLCKRALPLFFRPRTAFRGLV